MSQTWPLSLFFFLSCICLLTKEKTLHGQQVEGENTGKLKTSSEQAKKSQTNKVRHGNKWWLIETTSNEEDETTNNEEGGTTNNQEGGEYGEDLILTTVPTTCVPGKFMIISQNVMLSTHFIRGEGGRGLQTFL